MGRHGCREDPRCYKTFEKEENLKKHIQSSHKGGREQEDFKCDQCGEQFNKFTTLKWEMKTKMAKLTLRETFEKHLWIHKVVSFKCSCEGIPDLRPGQYMWNKFCIKIFFET